MISKLFIANRGEVAVRIAKTARAMGIATVAGYSAADTDALFLSQVDESVLIGPGPASESYLNQDIVLSAALDLGATAIHPGYGFLSENADFAEKVIAAGLTWVGPLPSTMRRLGLKIGARKVAQAAGVPVVPGYDASQDPDEMQAAAGRLGYPVMVKASAGGGGKGIRIARSEADFDAAYAAATEESRRAFGDSDMIVEKYITKPRHVEVQILGDVDGNIIHLGTRECSAQRKHQKLIEEAPATNLSEGVLEALTSAAVAVASSVDYLNAGTVEFVLDAETEEFYFLEVNTRLQVEHPVTEAVTGFDIVELQLLIAAGLPLPMSQTEVEISGHAFEARVLGENPSTGFAPQTGTVLALGWPKGSRVDSGVVPGSSIPVFYDSLIAKVIVHGADRETARQLLSEAIGASYVAGPGTNLHFLHWFVNRPEMINATVTTNLIDGLEIPDLFPTNKVLSIAAAFAQTPRPDVFANPWSKGLRLVPHVADRTVLLGYQGQVYPATPAAVERSVDGFRTESLVGVVEDGRTYVFTSVGRDQYERDQAAGTKKGASNDAIAPFPGLIAEVHVSVGQEVEEGDTVVTLEAMKMLHPVVASGRGIVESVEVAQGVTVESGVVLVRFQRMGPDEDNS